MRALAGAAGAASLSRRPAWGPGFRPRRPLPLKSRFTAEPGFPISQRTVTHLMGRIEEGDVLASSPWGEQVLFHLERVVSLPPPD